MRPVPEKALSTLATHCGAEPTGLTKIGGGEPWSDGIVYAFDTPAGERRVLKILAFDPADTQAQARFQARVDFVHFLGERGVPIAYPLVLPSGGLVEQDLADGTLFCAYVMERIDGHTIDAHDPTQWNDAFFQRWGAVVGHMHRLTGEYTGDVPATLGLDWRTEMDGFEAICQEEEVKAVWCELRSELEALPRDRTCFGFVHNDPHPWNLVISADGSLTVLDFDCANYHWFMADIAIAAYGAYMGAGGGPERPPRELDFPARFLSAFRAGYETEFHLEQAWWERLPLFLRYRSALLFMCFYDEVAKHPEHMRRWVSRLQENAPIPPRA